MLNENTNARIALFNRRPQQDDKEGVSYPLMFGSIENRDFKINVSAFLKTNSSTQAKFLSLSIRNENDEQTFSGTLHRNNKPGKEDTYYGYISEQFVNIENGENVYSTSEWQLGIEAKILVSEGTGTKYIGGKVYPKRAKTASAATSEKPAAEEIAF
ncbi:hypothetical protein [Janthinobacterium sp. MDT1-19]|uniref:hypothetical protein n=1 Tax=Janthinobacterium sp. MDT1-19 TaxID=1259339 RepID=UPI003F28DF93